LGVNGGEQPLLLFVGVWLGDGGRIESVFSLDGLFLVGRAWVSLLLPAVQTECQDALGLYLVMF